MIKKAIWGTDGQAIPKKDIPVQTIKPKTDAQINPKPQPNAMSGMDEMSGMTDKKPQISPKQQHLSIFQNQFRQNSWMDHLTDG